MLETDLQCEPTDFPQYLLYSSCHPVHGKGAYHSASRLELSGFVQTNPHEACGRPSAWYSTPEPGKKVSHGRDPPQLVAPHALRGVVGAQELCR